MARKTKEAPAMPEQPLRKEEIEIDQFVSAMRTLKRSPEYGLLQRFWARERLGILEDGKRKPSEAAWSVLKGFDAAIVVVEKFSDMQTGADLMKQRHAELMQSLGDK